MSWKPVVAGVDGSQESVRAAVTGAMVAERAGVECHLVHAVPDYLASFTTPDPAMDVSALERMTIDHAHELIESSLKDHVRDGLLAGLRVEIGRAPVALMEAVQRTDAGLVVLGGKHHRGVDRLGGSTVTHLARVTEVPMLATDGGSPTITRVLAAVDLSYAAQPTIAEAEKFAKLFGAKLRVIHVVEPVPIIPGVPMTVGDDAYFRAEARVLETAVWPLVTMPEAETVVRRGRAAAAITDEVAKWHADLLVVGSHGKGWVNRLLIGSTSDRLLHVLPTLTLVLPVTRPAKVRRGLGRTPLPWESGAVAGAESRT